MVHGTENGGERCVIGCEAGGAAQRGALAERGCPLRVIKDKAAHPQHQIAGFHGGGGDLCLAVGGHGPSQGGHLLPGDVGIPEGAGCVVECAGVHGRTAELC